MSQLETKSIFMGFTVPPSIDDIEAVAEAILDDMPDGLSKYTHNLKIQVEDFPDAFVEQEMELETPFDILGCYQSAGPAAIGRLGNGRGTRQDTLYLYRRPLLDVWAESGEDLTRLINHVILQEIGTHFGFSQDDLQMYEEDMFGATALGTSIGSGF